MPDTTTCTYEVYDHVGNLITEVDGCTTPEEFVSYWRARNGGRDKLLDATIINGGAFVEFYSGLGGVTLEAQATRVTR